MADQPVVAPAYSVIIPAHNEASVIARLLDALTRDIDAADPTAPEIIVVCNGCTDGTARVARAAAPHARVIELDTGSKPLALNTGNDLAAAWPRFFVDADIIVGHHDLLATAKTLALPDVMAAAPAIEFDLSSCSSSVKAYYKVWRQQPYLSRSMVGSGIFGLTQEGMARVERFPDIISDDGYVRSRFSEDERQSVSEVDGRAVSFTVFPPRDLASLIHVIVRRRRGNEQLQQHFPTRHSTRSTTAGTLLRSGKSGIADVLVYGFVIVASRFLLKFRRLQSREIGWQRDDSSR